LPIPSFQPTFSRQEEDSVHIHHANLDYFTLDKLTPKGPRANADVGEPHDATRPLVKLDAISAGSWWCAAGGWPSLTPRATTEIFYVFSGHGCLTDLDGNRNYFGPGDTVILPKGWSGRWDVLKDIHKVWFVHDHPDIEVTMNPIRAIITHYNALVFSAHCLENQGSVRPDATRGLPKTIARTLYDIGPTEVGTWSCSPGSFPYLPRDTDECFYVLDGLFFLTNADGTAQRCTNGDTVVIPKGWYGTWDILETVTKLWVIV